MLRYKPLLRSIATSKPKIGHESKNLDSARYLISISLFIYLFISAVAHNLYWNCQRGAPGQQGLNQTSFPSH